MQKGQGVYAGGLSRFAMGSSSFYGLPPAMRISPNALMALYQAEAVYVGENSQIATAAIPNGYEPPYSWQLAIRPAGMSAYTTVNGVGGISDSNLLLGKDLSASLTGDGTISQASINLIVSLVSALAGSSTLSADLKGALSLAANLAGEGDVTAALGGLLFMSASVGGQAELEAVLAGILSMSANITVTGTGLTTANVGQAVWSAIASANNESGTMGEKLNDAGSAGNPWATLLAGNNTPGTFGHYVQTTLDVKVDGIKKNTDIIPALL